MRGIGPALALMAACALLFGGSFTAARLARDDDRARVAPSREAPPAVLPDTELALGPAAPDLPGLRRATRPKQAATAPTPSAPAPASPAPRSEPSPQPVSNRSPKPSEPSPSEPSQPSPSEPSQPSPSEPSQPSPTEPSTPASQLPSEVEFYDSGG
jgi:outer membrane biosynthesis protein TonB